MIWHTRGDWYSVEYTVGDDPAMRYAKYQLKDVENGLIEGRIMTLLADSHKCDHGKIKLYGAIVRSVS